MVLTDTDGKGKYYTDANHMEDAGYTHEYVSSDLEGKKKYCTVTLSLALTENQVFADGNYWIHISPSASSDTELAVANALPVRLAKDAPSTGAAVGTSITNGLYFAFSIAAGALTTDEATFYLSATGIDSVNQTGDKIINASFAIDETIATSLPANAVTANTIACE